jgi:hypothetical protein
MINLIYASAAKNMMTSEELLEILKKARIKNEGLAITGMLLYRSGNFLQVLEGEESKVTALYDVIKTDPRHHQVLTIAIKPVKERLFSSWEMAFIDLDDVDPATVPGYSDYLSQPFKPHEFANNPTFAHKFLTVFRDNIR